MTNPIALLESLKNPIPTWNRSNLAGESINSAQGFNRGIDAAISALSGFVSPEISAISAFFDNAKQGDKLAIRLANGSKFEVVAGFQNKLLKGTEK